MHIYDILIIGGGPAGYTAALYAARAGLDTLIIEKMSVGGQMSSTGIIENYPGFEDGIDGISLSMKMQQGAEKFGAKTVYDEVISVDLSEKIKKTVTSFDEFYSKTVIIATGAYPKKLGVEGEDRLVGKGVHYCAHCDGRFYKDKTVAVIGGGNTAVADALYLSRLAKKVYLIHRRNSLRATKIYHKSLSESKNIDIMWDSTVNELVYKDRLSSLKIKNIASNEITSLDIDGLFVSIGREPESQIFDGKILTDKNGYILTDETLKTNIDGVYAVGDVRKKSLRQIVTAVADGATAVHHLEEYLSSETKNG
ncbi:MAG: thioredoxin-disulfide reductase [Ruminococcaceae bacterium]|nr:thioredoxin-disulfide reductase [Oscillospiraceae bacterium]